MNESLIRKFCESKHRKLIVVIVTTVFGLLVLIPLVDEYFDNKESHTALVEELERARLTAEGLPEIEQQVAEITKKLTAMEARSITSDSLGNYRNSVVEMVRGAGCQVRRLEIDSPSRRAWVQKDNPLKATSSQEAKKTPFALERRKVLLLVDGPMKNLREILGLLHKEDSMAYLHRLELQSGSRSSGQVTLEIEMWLFALGRQKA